MDTFFNIAAPALFVGFGLYFLYRMFRHGSLRGAMFGAKVVRSIGEVPAESQGPVRIVLKVHLLEREGTGTLVGVELAAKSFASYQTMPATLTPQEAMQLSTLLQEAARAQ